MKIDSVKLRQEINKLYCEMGFISKTSVKKIITKLEQEEEKINVGVVKN